MCACVSVSQGSALGQETLQIAQVSDTVCEKKKNVFLSLRTSDVCLTYYF